MLLRFISLGAQISVETKGRRTGNIKTDVLKWGQERVAIAYCSLLVRNTYNYRNKEQFLQIRRRETYE